MGSVDSDQDNQNSLVSVRCQNIGVFEIAKPEKIKIQPESAATAVPIPDVSDNYKNRILKRRLVVKKSINTEC